MTISLFATFMGTSALRMWWKITPKSPAMLESARWIATLSVILTALLALPLKKGNFVHLKERIRYLRNSTTIRFPRGSYQEPEHSSSTRVPNPPSCVAATCPTEPRWPSDWPLTRCLSPSGAGGSVSLINYQLSGASWASSLGWVFSAWWRSLFGLWDICCRGEISRNKIINMWK